MLVRFCNEFASIIVNCDFCFSDQCSVIPYSVPTQYSWENAVGSWELETFPSKWVWIPRGDGSWESRPKTRGTHRGALLPGECSTLEFLSSIVGCVTPSFD